MADSFAANMDNCSNDHSMDITFDPDWLENRDDILKSVDGLTIDQVPVLKFSPKGKLAIKGGNLWVLGGNHRRMAVIKYMKKLEAESEKTKELIAKIKDGKTEDELANLSEDNQATLRLWEEKLPILDAKMKTSRLWSVRIYDRGASSESVHTLHGADAVSP